MKTNEELQKDVMAEFKWDSQLSDVASQIGVSTKEGIVTLTGSVNSYSKKLAAERAAQGVHGVSVVASDIVVTPASFGAKSDTEIAEAIKNALLWHSLVDEEMVKVKVDRGWVTLDGEVDYAYQRISAADAVDVLRGVKGVANHIIVKVEPVDTKEIKSKIAAAYHRSATVDSYAIKMEAVAGKVTLRGAVRSWVEKKEAERIAFASPGVISVDNRIEIDMPVFV